MTENKKKKNVKWDENKNPLSKGFPAKKIW